MSTKLGTLTLDLVARIGSFTQGMRDASASAEREMGRAGNSVNTMDGLLKKLAVTAGAVFSVSQIANYADSYTGMVNKMKLVTDGQNQLSTAMGDTHKIAQATASDWSSVVDVYTKFQKISDRLGLSQSEVARITETVTKAVGISGASADEAQRSLVQFSQALSLGVLRGQDLNSVMQQTPGLTDAIAKGMGVTSDKLKQMGSDGVLTTQKVVEALQKVAGSIDADYAETATLIASSFSLVKNEAIKMIGEFDQAHGISQTFVQGMTSVADNLENITRVMAIAGAYMAGTYIPMIIKGTYATVSDTVSKVANIAALRAKAVADYDVAKSNLAATAAMARAMGATNAQTAAMMANARAAYQQAAAAKAAALSGAGLSSALLGPVGMGVALATVAAGYIYMSSKGDKANEMLESQSKYAGMAADELLRLDGAKRKSAEADLSKEVGILNDKLKASENQFEALVEKVLDSNSANAEAKKIWAELRAGAIGVDEAYSRLNQSDFVTNEQINQLSDSKKKVDDGKAAIKLANEQLDKVRSSGDGAKKGYKDAAEGAAELNEELKKLIELSTVKSQENLLRSNLIDKGFKDGLIDLILEYRKKEDLLGKAGRLSDASIKAIGEQWKTEEALNKSKENRLKLEEKSKKLIEAQGAAMKVNALVAANAAKANYAALEAVKGLPKGLLSAVNMTESPNSNYAKSGAGARGSFQFMPNTASAYKVDVDSVESSAKGASEYLNKLLKMFEGNLENALRAYNWGEGNMQNYLKYGSGMKKVNGKFQKGYFPDRPMPKETRDYSGKVLGYMGGVSGISFSENYSFDDYIKEQERFAIEREKAEREMAQKQKEIQVQYYDDLQKLEFDNQEKIKEIQESFANDPKERDRLIELQAKAYEVDMGNWLKAQDERIDAENEANKQIVLSRKAAFEEMNAAAAEMNRIGLEAKARASMTPYQYNEWRAGNEQQSSYSELADSFYSARNGIENNEYLLESEKNAQLLEVHEQYLEAKAALDDEYAQRERDLNQARYEDQLGLYGSLLSQASSVWGSMTDMVKESKGEQSKTYKAMFLAQQAIAIGQQIINTELAAMQPIAQMGIYGIPASMLIRGMGYASVGVIAAQTVAGMAHDGIDNIPKEGTWLLDKGERVVDKRTNGDLKDFIAKGANGGVTVNVNVPVGYIGKQSTDAEGNVTIDVVEQKFAQFIADIGKPNSPPSRAIQNAFGLSPNRSY